MDGGKRFRFDFAPYQREMMETPFLPDVQQTAYMLASRNGKTEVMMNILGHSISESPRRILVMYPTISQAEKWSKETLMSELVAPTRELDDIIGDGAGRRKSGNTILHKLFPGGMLNIFGSNAPGEMRRAKGNLILADEIDAITGSESDEGDALEILWVRGSEYPDTIRIAASYPSIKGQSKIEALMLKSDFRQWISACLHCGHEFQMHRKHLRYNIGKPEDAVIECPSCSKAINDKQRVEMSTHASKWVASRPFTGIAGFQGNRMMSPHPTQKGFVSHLHWCAVQEINADSSENREKAMMVLVNTFDGEPYSAPTEEKPDPSIMQAQAHDYLRADAAGMLILPHCVLVIVIGADVQGDRIEAEIVGFGENGQTWGLGYHILHGNTLEPEVWHDFDGLTLTEFSHPSGKIMKPACVCIDSGFRPDRVREFTQPRQARRVFSIFGSRVLGKPIITQPKKSGKHRIYEIGTHDVKGIIYQRAHLTKATGAAEYPHGFQHFPIGYGYHEQYYQRLISEDVELKKASDGDFYQFFSKKEKVRNEPLDCRVYAMAAEKILNPNYGIIAKRMLEKG
jgi:phage terminase large subunit GpA-like protein